MWRIVLTLLAISSVARANSDCQPAESSKSDLRRATAIVERLPELAKWTDDNAVFDTGEREKVRGRCYEAVYVYSVMPSKDLDLRYVFLVYLPTKAVLFQDIGTLEHLTLTQWRARRSHGSEP
jgi:hypothetical protein